jgi:ubiquinone/menaquinone biosynthesis C-methylase UbiE
MAIDNDSPYLPKSKARNGLSSLKTSVAYRIWRSKLTQYVRFSKKSRFKLLEVGCGPGYFLRCFEKWFPQSELVGLDINRNLIEHAQKYLSKTKLLTHDGHKLPFSDKSFDVLCSLQVIEHLEKPESFFKEANRVLRKDGILILSTPNPTGIPANVLKHKWKGFRYDHISLKTPGQWRDILSNSGFSILDDGTTLLTGFKILQKLPFALINWIPMAIFGYFPWYKGESYMAIAKKM